MSWDVIGQHGSLCGRLIGAVDAWLTTDQGAEYLKVTRSTIYRWADDGRLPYYELESGGGRRYRREDLDGMMAPTGAYDIYVARSQNLVHIAPHGHFQALCSKAVSELMLESGLLYDLGWCAGCQQVPDYVRNYLHRRGLLQPPGLKWQVEFAADCDAARALGHDLDSAVGDLKNGARTECLTCGRILHYGHRIGVSGPLVKLDLSLLERHCAT